MKTRILLVALVLVVVMATGDYWGHAQAGDGMLYFDGMLTK